MAALNDLEVKVGDVLNAYITAPITEKVWTVLGPEFGLMLAIPPLSFVPCTD
jgi:hypothetical protein